MHDRGYSVHTWNVLMIAFQVPSQFDTVLKHVWSLRLNRASTTSLSCTASDDNQSDACKGLGRFISLLARIVCEDWRELKQGEPDFRLLIYLHTRQMEIAADYFHLTTKI